MKEKILNILIEKTELSLTGDFKAVYIDGFDNVSEEIIILLREELIKFHIWLEYSSQCLGVIADVKYSTDVVNEYLKNQQ